MQLPTLGTSIDAAAGSNATAVATRCGGAIAAASALLPTLCCNLVRPSAVTVRRRPAGRRADLQLLPV